MAETPERRERPLARRPFRTATLACALNSREFIVRTTLAEPSIDVWCVAPDPSGPSTPLAEAQP